MNGSFDPYYHWLGIPPGDQPPNHYRLLGVAEFERDPEVIQNAADRQMMRGKAAGIIRRTSTSIPRTQAAVQQLDAVAKLGGQLHNKARLHLRLAAEIDGRELPLLQLGQVGPQQALRSPRVPAAHVGHMQLLGPMCLTRLTASDWPLGAIGLK